MKKLVVVMIVGLLAAPGWAGIRDRGRIPEYYFEPAQSTKEEKTHDLIVAGAHALMLGVGLGYVSGQTAEKKLVPTILLVYPFANFCNFLKKAVYE